MTLKDANASWAKIEEELANKVTEISKVNERLVAATANKDVISPAYAKLRTERQVLLGKGEDAAKITQELKDHQERLELAEDTVAGLESEKQRLNLGKEALEVSRKRAETDVVIAEAQDLAKDYNAKAAELAPVVKRLGQLRLELERRGVNGVLFSPDGWGHNALHVIPRIFTSGEVPPTNPYEQTFWNGSIAKSELFIPRRSS